MTGTRETGNIGADERGGANRKPAGRTRLLMVLGFVAVAGGVSGCFFGGSDDGPSCFDRQVVNFTWEIVKNVNDAPLTCEGAAASSIELNVGSMQQAFPCPTGFQARVERSFPLADGVYPVSLQLIDFNNQVISDTGIMNFAVPQCRPLNLGLITFGTP